MYTVKCHKSTTAQDLPAKWDDVTRSHPFLNTFALKVLESVNPCGQCYYAYYADDALDSVFMTYQIHLNLFTFRKGSLRLPVTVVGVPCSVSLEGYVIGERTQQHVHKTLQEIKGSTLILNMPENRPFQSFVTGATLPSYRMDLPWVDFDTYLLALRSHYRYRIRRALQKGKALEIVDLKDNRCFDEGLYSLYREVFKRSAYPLECMPIEFFQQFPATITVFKAEGRSIAFTQRLAWKGTLYFLFGGMSYETRDRYDTYMNMLLNLIRSGIAGDISALDLGQTAGETKMRLGGLPVFKGMAARHSSPVLRFALKGLMPYVSRPEEVNSFKVYKDDLGRAQGKSVVEGEGGTP